jgi:hypothetical protein
MRPISLENSTDTSLFGDMDEARKRAEFVSNFLPCLTEVIKLLQRLSDGSRGLLLVANQFLRE